MPTSLLTLAVAVTIGAPVPKAKVPNYFPTEVGTKWEYKTSQLKNPMQTREVTEVVDIDGITTVVIETTEGFQKGLKDRFVIKDGGVRQAEKAGKEIDPPMPMLKLGMNKGDTWKAERVVPELNRINPARAATREQRHAFEVGQPEELDTPGGKFNAIPVHHTQHIGDGGPVITRWYAQGVGLVKQASKSGITTLELKSFTPGKPGAKAAPKKDK